jgi:predicted phage terminase large subunit-like protein
MNTVDHHQNLSGLLLEHRARALEGNFRAFTEAAWPILEPSTPFIGGRHIDAISEYLTAVTIGQIRRLVVNIPPRMTKSTLGAILWPCWTWASDDASSRWMFCSYSASLSVKHSVDRRTLLTSEWYRRLWPKVQLAEDQNLKQEFASTNRGHMIATSVGATTTGKGGGILVIDDPHSVEQALSDAEREAGVRYIRQTLMTRLDDPRSGRIVVIMQRLHQLDVTGELLRDGGWEHLCLPAIAEKRTSIHLPISGIEIVREEGDLLEPQRLGQKALDDLKRSMGSYAFAGQMLQTPAPAEGGLFKRSWWQRYTVAPENFDSIVQSWDCAFKEKKDADYVVGQVWGFSGPQAYLLDQVRARMGYVRTKQAMRDMHAKWPQATHILIEDKANGSAVIDELKGELPGVIGVEPEGGKLARAWACTAQVEAGQVFLPDAPWVEDFLVECSTFPMAAYDDAVDAATQALNWRRKHMHSYGVLEYLEQEQLSMTQAKQAATQSNPTQCPRPECGSVAVAQTTSHFRCNQCGHQWLRRKLEPEPNRLPPRREAFLKRDVF